MIYNSVKKAVTSKCGEGKIIYMILKVYYDLHFEAMALKTKKNHFYTFYEYNIIINKVIKVSFVALALVVFQIRIV